MIELVGTAHVSEKSVRQVRDKILALKPEIIAVELCLNRYNALTKKQKTIEIKNLLKGENLYLFLTNLFLAYIQRKIGKEVGIEPGKDMLSAIETGKEINAEIILIDRDIRITLRRLLNKISFFEKLRILKELLFGFWISLEEEEIDNMLKEDVVTVILEELKKISPTAHEVLVDERDAYMALQLKKVEDKNVVAVVGAGHVPGIRYYLENIPSVEIESLEFIPKKKFSTKKVLAILIPGIFIFLFGYSLYKGINVIPELNKWIFIHMVLASLGVVIARGSFVSAVVAGLASPFTSLNPMLAAGWFAGITEAWIRKINLNDFEDMVKSESLGDLYENNFFRVLLVAALANLGSLAGTIISFPVVLKPLIEKLVST